MLQIIGIIALVIAVILIAVLVYAATKPDGFRIQRTKAINAPPEKIFPLIDDLRAHTAWSPFEKDPAMKRTHSGAPRGKGSVYEWDGNRQVGRGRIAITDSMPPSKVTMALDMFTPFEAHNTVEFSVEPASGSAAATTNVTWVMHGRQPYMAKLFSTFVNCDKMVGSQFEEGLAKLKALAEK
jgi:uncharacterized protein YndB with AHSA1/START domain